jgi:hypothetical protein
MRSQGRPQSKAEPRVGTSVRAAAIESPSVPAMTLKGKELVRIATFLGAEGKPGYPWVGKYFPFYAEKCRLL